MAKVKNEILEFDINSEEAHETIYAPEVDERIAELAYYKSEQRGFAPGYELDDWLAAEKELILEQ